jgi:hypothetical protein
MVCLGDGLAVLGVWCPVGAMVTGLDLSLSLETLLSEGIEKFCEILIIS